MSGLLNYFCGFILASIHFIYHVLLQAKLAKFVVRKMIYNASIAFRDRRKIFVTEARTIDLYTRNFSKVPKHMTIALGEECVSYEDLIQIISWCLPAGITCLSIYDHKDEIDASKLYKLFFKKFEELVPRIKWGVSFPKDEPEKSYTNGVSKRSRLQVNVLTSKHGRQLLIDSIKELCTSTELKLEDRASTEIALNDVMQSKLEYSGDPDLLVISGNVYTSYGLSPWHIGFTEFSIIPSYRLLTLDSFIQILRRYADCEQKFGR